MSRTKFMGIFLVILGVISIVVGIVRGDMCVGENTSRPANPFVKKVILF